MNQLQKLGEAEKWLSEAKSLDDFKQIHDIAKAAEAYAQAHKLGLEAENHAREIKFVAGLRMAELKPGESAEERGRKGGKKAGVSRPKKATTDKKQPIISPKKMAEFRKLDKAMNENELREKCHHIGEQGEKITYNRLLRGDWYHK